MAESRTALSRVPQMTLVLLDLNISDSRGVDTVKQFRAMCEELGVFPRIVVVSGSEDVRLMCDILKEHATGFIPKGVSERILQSAVRLTLDGGVYIPEAMLQNIEVSAGLLTAPRPDSTHIGKLTEMERLVAAYCVQGLTYKHIAHQISAMRGRTISDLTVKTHVKNLSFKLGIQNEGKAAVVAQISRLNLLFPAPAEQLHDINSRR
ncbi:DNA-binding response regulator [Pseudoduganella albidiflava]|nr:DNA-binding response regulator [Pseudoduganella albidiflava]